MVNKIKNIRIADKNKSKIDVKKVAKLANLPLSPAEEKLYQKQLEDILSYVDQIEQKVKATDVEPTFNVSSSQNVQSKDQEIKSLTQDEALANAKNKKDGYFVTKGIFAEE